MMGYSSQMAKGTWEPAEALSLIELAVRNPYDPDVVAKRREAAARDRWPRDTNAWRSLWESLPPPLQADPPALIASMVGAGDEAGVAEIGAGLERRARNMLKDILDPCAEISCRALRVGAALAAIVGNTPMMDDVRRTSWAAAFGERLDTALGMRRLFQTTPVLVEGQTGTGKELVAQALCLSMPGSWKRGQGWTAAPTESVHLASLPESLAESALFGHERGAYSGAHKERQGVLERCHGGVVFLDEIAELPMSTQVTLLRTLQEGTARRLGADSDHAAAPRIVSATHKDLSSLVGEDSFRLDLLYRLSSVVIKLPPLVDRRADIPLLVEREAQRIAEPAVRPALRDRFERFIKEHADYVWPGNVRELHAVVRTLALGLTPALRSAVRPGKKIAVPKGIADGTATLQEAQVWYCRRVVSTAKQMASAAKVLDIDRGTLRGYLAEGGDGE